MCPNCDKAEADNVALRTIACDLLAQIVAAPKGIGMFRDFYFPKLSITQCDDAFEAVRNAPDPGAGVRAVVEAARNWKAAWIKNHNGGQEFFCEGERELWEAVRALRGEEGGGNDH